MEVINAEGKPIGRISSEASEKAMKGKKVRIINSEKAIITGDKKEILEKYREKFNLRDIGNPAKAPKTVSRRPDLFIKKTIKGMIPEEKRKGKKALRRIKAYIKNPENLESKNKEDNKNKTDRNHMTVKEVCEKLGWRDQK